MKKVVSGVLLAGTLFAGSNVMAEEAVPTVDLNSELFQTKELMQAGEYALTENPIEKALLSDEDAEESLIEVKVALQKGDVEALLAALDKMITSLEKIQTVLEEAKADATEEPVV